MLKTPVFSDMSDEDNSVKKRPASNITTTPPAKIQQVMDEQLEEDGEEEDEEDTFRPPVESLMDDPGEDSTDAEVDKEKIAESIYADNKDASLVFNYITC